LNGLLLSTYTFLDGSSVSFGHHQLMIEQTNTMSRFYGVSTIAMVT